MPVSAQVKVGVFAILLALTACLSTRADFGGAQGAGGGGGQTTGEATHEYANIGAGSNANAAGELDVVHGVSSARFGVFTDTSESVSFHSSTGVAVELALSDGGQVIVYDDAGNDTITLNGSGGEVDADALTLVTAEITSGAGSPEGALSAPAGSMYLSTGGTLYFKGSGAGNTGWLAVTAAAE